MADAKLIDLVKQLQQLYGNADLPTLANALMTISADAHVKPKASRLRAIQMRLAAERLEVLARLEESRLGT